MNSIDIKKTALEAVIKLNNSLYSNNVSKLIEDAGKVEDFLNKKATTIDVLFSALATIDDVESTEEGETRFYFDVSEKNSVLVDLFNNADCKVEFEWCDLNDKTAFTLTFR